MSVRAPDDTFFRVIPATVLPGVRVQLRELRRYYGSRVLEEVMVYPQEFPSGSLAVEAGKLRVVAMHQQSLADKVRLDEALKLIGDHK